MALMACRWSPTGRVLKLVRSGDHGGGVEAAFAHDLEQRRQLKRGE
jgi:hypothetical protein